MCAAEMSNMTDLWISGVFFQALNTPKLVCRRGGEYDRFVDIRCVFSSSKYSKTRLSPGLRPGPRWGEYDAPILPSPLGRGTPPPRPDTLPPRRRTAEVEPWLGLGKLQ